ncbi:MAG TPA: hypothetical protein VNH82_08150 [Candidatus Dormibacteraeota bacterium]|nr:hypothetical protein [Candidatus Dormibacteraeota bacterium]
MEKPNLGRKRRGGGLTKLRERVAGRLGSGSLGQGMVEYSLILLLVAIAVMVIFTVFGHRVSDVYSNINNGLGTASG